MCTVTTIPEGGGSVRLMCNRDERRSRPAALPPRVLCIGRRRAVLPIDPVSRGTWVAVNDAGLALTVLNVSRPLEKAAGQIRKSRGSIIPGLLHCGSLSEALDEVMALEAREHSPFRLVLADDQEVAEVRSEGESMRIVQRGPVQRPMLFTSSGLGDHLVEGPRRRLFETSFRGPGSWAPDQQAFHRHSWSDQTPLSVCMSRADARTVSCTLVELHPERAVMTYHPDAPDQPAQSVTVCLELHREVMP